MPDERATDVAIECERVRRVFSRGFWPGAADARVALAGLSFRVKRGSVFALLGPNGAGKTTTVKILSTLLTPTQGRAWVSGFDVVRQTADVRRHIGLALGGDRGFFERLSGEDNLRYYAAISGLSRRHIAARIDAVVAMLSLSAAAHRPVRQYSRGTKQRLHLALALLTDPEVIFMDEPTLGLDPEMALQFRRLIPTLSMQGKTILITTNNLGDAETLCDEVAVIHGGRLIALGSPRSLREQWAGSRVLECTVKLRDNVLAEIQGTHGVETVESVPVGENFNSLRVVLRAEAPMPRVHDLLRKVSVGELQERSGNLEDAYLALVRVAAQAEMTSDRRPT